jgi:hypothetical protein
LANVHRRAHRGLSKATATNGVATVVDRMTTIPWQRESSPEALAWERAKEYCTSLGRAARLPTAKELLSVVDWAAPAAIDLQSFPDTTPGKYWTTTTVPGGTSAALTVSFGDATYTGTHLTPTNEAHQVRCVVTP